MRRLALTCALFLTACAEPRVELAAPHVPADLLRPVVVRCADGQTAAALGNCAIALRAGLNRANGQIETVGAMLGE
jgi:hypothetical protein